MNSAHLKKGTSDIRPRAKGKQAAEKSVSFPKVLKAIAHVTCTTRFSGAYPWSFTQQTRKWKELPKG